MPYIKQEDRDKLAQGPKEWAADTAGELNYEITVLVNRYIKENGPLNYNLINTVVGAMESAKLEFYRRVAIPYENGKIKENGDVYPKEIAPSV